MVTTWATWATGTARAVVRAEVAHAIGVEQALLVGRELAVEGLHGFTALAHAGGALRLHLLHEVDALGRGHPGHGVTVEARAPFHGGWLHGGGEGGPGAFLCRGDLQLGLELLHAAGVALGHALLHLRRVEAAAARAHAVTAGALLLGLGAVAALERHGAHGLGEGGGAAGGQGAGHEEAFAVGMHRGRSFLSQGYLSNRAGFPSRA